jgi:hypothetical protein
MEFTQYIWDLYAASETGRAAVSRPPESFGEFHPEWAEWRVQTYRPTADEGIEPIEDDFAVANIFDDVRLCLASKTPDSLRAADELFESMIDEGLEICPEDDNEDRFYIHGATGFEDEIFSNIEVFSLTLFKVFPEYFAPLLYRGEFDRFVSLCTFFRIPIPPPPGKNKKRERACYYLRINEALQEFRSRHSLTPAELVAFLYDFAPKMMASQEDRELPPPSKVWFTMGGIGGNGDF